MYIFKNINKYLLFISIILCVFFFIIIILYLYEKNTIVQNYLEDIHKRIRNHQNKFSNVVNDN